MFGESKFIKAFIYSNHENVYGLFKKNLLYKLVSDLNLFFNG